MLRHICGAETTPGARCVERRTVLPSLAARFHVCWNAAVQRAHETNRPRNISMSQYCDSCAVVATPWACFRDLVLHAEPVPVSMTREVMARST